MTHMKKISLLCAAFLGMAHAQAADFSGFTLGVIGGFGSTSFQSKTKVEPGQDINPSGGLFGIQAGAGWMLSPRIYLGGTLNYIFSSAKKTVDWKNDYNGKKLIGDIKEKARIEALVKVGLVFNQVMPYLEAGYVYNKLTLKQKATFEYSVDISGSGFAYGAGLDFKPLKNLVLSIGYRGSISSLTPKLGMLKDSAGNNGSDLFREKGQKQIDLEAERKGKRWIHHSIRVGASYAF